MKAFLSLLGTLVLTFTFLVATPNAASSSTCTLTGSGTVGQPYQVTSEQELRNLEHCLPAITGSSDSSASTYFSLEQSIKLSSAWPASEIEWLPAGSFASLDDYGTETDIPTLYFDGNGHTISNLTIQDSSGRGFDHGAGLFGTVPGLILNDLQVLANDVFPLRGQTGIVVGHTNYLEASNLHVEFESIDGTAIGCSDNRGMGAVAGWVGYASELRNVSAYSPTGITGGEGLGGLIGFSPLVDIQGAYYEGDISSECEFSNWNGGIVGQTYWVRNAGETRDVIFRDVVFKGNVNIPNGSESGGIVGYLSWDAVFERIAVYGSVTTKNNSGGLIGKAVEFVNTSPNHAEGDLTINDVIMAADVTATAGIAGLLLGSKLDGEAGQNSSSTIDDVLLLGEVSATTNSYFVGFTELNGTSSYGIGGLVSYTPSASGTEADSGDINQTASAADFADFSTPGITVLDNHVNSASSPFKQCAGMAFPVLKKDGFICQNTTLDYTTADGNFPLSAGAVNIADDGFVDYSTSFNSVRRLELTSELPSGLFFNRITGTITGTTTACSFNGFTVRAHGAGETRDFTVATAGFELCATGPVPYTGPLISGLGSENIPSGYETSPGETLRVNGQRLSNVTTVVISEILVIVDSASSDHFIFTLPTSLEAGGYDLVVQSSIGNLTYLDALTIMDAPAVSEYADMAAWTKDMGDGTAKVYVKFPTIGEKVRIGHQTGGSGSYETIFVKTLDSETDSALTVNVEGSYIVRTIDLVDGTNRIRVTVGDSTEVQVRYNE